MNKQKVTLTDKTFRPYIPESGIQEAVAQVAGRISEDFAGSSRPPVLLCVLNGAMPFFSDLIMRLGFNIEVASIKMTSYSGTTSTGVVKTDMGLTADVRGKDVIIVEDIVDSGATVARLGEILDEAGAASHCVCTMFFKRGMFKGAEAPRYVGMEIGNDFVVGYGLDYNELGRNLRDLYVLDI